MAAPFTLTFDVAGEKQIARSFSRFAEDVKDMRAPFSEMADDFKEIEKGQFESIGSRGGQKWRKLSPRYARWKAKHHSGKPLMVLSGSLKDALTGGTGHIRDIRPLTLRLGADIEYGLYHQRGTSRGLPRRPLILLTEEDRRRWAKYVHAYMEKQMKKDFRQVDAGLGAASLSHLRSI